MNPNKSFRDRNKPVNNPCIELIFKSHKILFMICRECFASVSMSIRPGMAFRPDFVVCKRCGSKEWDYNIE